MGTGFERVFGGATIYPSEISYSAIALDADTQLYWPLDAIVDVPLVTRIMDVDAATADLKLAMPNATQVSPGETVLFNNVGAEQFEVTNVNGTQLIVLTPGTAWQLYLKNNGTDSGTWFALQYGAAISQANASELAGAGLIAVGLQLIAAMPVTLLNSDYSLGPNDQANSIVWDNTGPGTLILDDPITVKNGWFVGIVNGGGGTLTVESLGTFTIDGLSSKAFPPGASALLLTDGTNYYTLGFNAGASGNFDYTVINVPGSGNYVLSGSELNRIGYRFTGLLTGNRDVIVPAVAQEYWVNNETTGSYDLTITTLSGTGIVVAANQRRILYCDGTNVVDADNTNFSTPLAVNQGGTGSTTANGALANLGGTSTGIALFKAASQAAARAALGAFSGGTF